MTEYQGVVDVLMPEETKVQDLPHGLYQIFWHDGSSSVASVGSDSSGRRWYAPTNWITVPGYDWSKVDYVRPIQ